MFCPSGSTATVSHGVEGSVRLTLTGLDATNGAVRLKTSDLVYVAFGDNTVVASAADMPVEGRATEAPTVEVFKVPASATDMAVYARKGASVDVTVGTVATYQTPP